MQSPDFVPCSRQKWCGRRDLNPHAFRRHPLKMVCLPVPPLPPSLQFRWENDRALRRKMRREATLIITKLRSPAADGGERSRVEAGAAHQRAINFFLRHQRSRVFGFHAAAVQNADLPRDLCAENRFQLGADNAMRRGGYFWGGCFAGADGPYRLLCDRNLAAELVVDLAKRALRLSPQNLIG